MDWTHLHLALNHVPVLGTPFLLGLLLWSWAFLVDEDRTADFRAEIDQGVSAVGLRCVLSGPLPPYSFVGRLELAGAA